MSDVIIINQPGEMDTENLLSRMESEDDGIQSGATNLSTRNSISQLQKEIASRPQVNCPLTHAFTSGVYARTILLPKGTVIIGKIHKHDHFNFIQSGHVTVTSEFGKEELRGPLLMVSKAGTKRAVFAHEDTVWTTIHANPSDETDLDVIESDIIAKSYKELAELSPDDKGLTWQENYQ